MLILSLSLITFKFLIFSACASTSSYIFLLYLHVFEPNPPLFSHSILLAPNVTSISTPYSSGAC